MLIILFYFELHPIIYIKFFAKTLKRELTQIKYVEYSTDKV
jgi:hypothetical protein